MKRVVKIKLGNKWQQIKIYLVGKEGSRSLHQPELIDTEYTNSRGLLRWMPPHNGIFNFINTVDPRYNLTGYSVTNEGGHADRHGNLAD